MKKLISIVFSVFLLSFLLEPLVLADVIELKDVFVDYRNMFPQGSDPIINSLGNPNKNLDKKLDLHVNADVLKYGYWDNMINSTTDKDIRGGGQFRVVGLEMAFGVRLFPILDVGYYHHSQHMLDGISMFHFPVEDAIEIKVYLYQKNRPEALFNF